MPAIFQERTKQYGEENNVFYLLRKAVFLSLAAVLLQVSLPGGHAAAKSEEASVKVKLVDSHGTSFSKNKSAGLGCRSR